MREQRRFVVGELYSHEEIYRSLRVGNAGGIRFSAEDNGTVRRAAVFTANPEVKMPFENPYQDRVESGVLVYTGTGKEGHQQLVGPNRRIVEQGGASGFPVYGFALIASRRDRTVGIRRWRFLGLLQFLRHYWENQIDSRGELRRALVFEFQILNEFDSVVPAYDAELYDELRKACVALIQEEDREIAGPDTGGSGTDGTGEDPVRLELIRSRMLVMSPAAFEVLVCLSLRRSGFEHVVTTPYSGDGGVDVRATAGPAMWPLRGLPLEIQAKRWSHTVGRREIAELRGSLRPHARGAVVTTSHFSRAAVMEARAEGKDPISLVDGQQFAAIIHRLGIDPEEAR